MIKKYDKKAGTMAAIRYICHARINFHEEVIRQIIDDHKTPLSDNVIFKLIDKYKFTITFERIKNKYFQQLESLLYKINSDIHLVRQVLDTENHKGYHWFSDANNNLYCTDDYELYEYFYVNYDAFIVLIEKS